MVIPAKIPQLESTRRPEHKKMIVLPMTVMQVDIVVSQ